IAIRRHGRAHPHGAPQASRGGSLRMTEIPVNGPKKNDASVADPSKPAMAADPHEWIAETSIRTTQDVQVPTRLIDQVLGQDDAVRVVRKAADQKRHILLIGEPGTGKSMLAKAMAEILPEEQQKDVIVYHNTKNPNS